MLESEQPAVEQPEPAAESASQDQPSAEAQPVGDENKPAEAEPKADDAVAPPAASVGENVEQPKPAEGEVKAEATPADGEKPKEGDEKLAEMEGSDTTIESDIDSDFDVMEEIDPSYAIDSQLWQTVADINLVDLKPAAKPEPEGEDGKPKPAEKKKEKEVVEEEEDSGFSELVVVRSEKERDQEFQEYIFELCRPSIVSYLPDRVAPKGSDVRLTCTVKGNNVMVKWLKDGEPLERKKNVQYRSDAEIHILEITKITEKDAGEYTAVFKNRAGEVETASRIKVYDGKLHKPDHIDIALVKGKSTRFSFLI